MKNQHLSDDEDDGFEKYELEVIKIGRNDDEKLNGLLIPEANPILKDISKTEEIQLIRQQQHRSKSNV